MLVWTWLLVRKGYVSGWQRLEESRRRLEEQATDLALVAEEVLADLSERAERLQALVAEADKLLAAAGAASPQPAAAAAASAPEPGQAPTPAPAPTQAAAPPAPAADDVPPALALVAALEAAAAGHGEVTAPARRSRAAEPPASHRAVWDLAEQGLDVTAIARRLQKTKGEVELILGLRRLG